MAVYIKDSGSYTINGTLTLSNVAFICSDLRLTARAALNIEDMLEGSRITLTSVAGRLPRIIAVGAGQADLACFSAPDGVLLTLIDGNIIASFAPIVIFDGNGATRAPAPSYMSASRSGVVARLPRAPQRSGYNFLGWNTEKDGGGEPFTNKTPVGGTGLVVYAQWADKNRPAEPAPAPIPEKRTPAQEPAAEESGGSFSDIVAMEDDILAAIRVTEDSFDEPPLVSPINFGSVLLGSTAKLEYRIRVFGEYLDGEIVWDEITGTGFSVAIDTSVQWNNKTGGKLVISFDPTGLGEYNYTGSLTLSSSSVEDGGVSIRIDLRASVRGAFINTTPSTLLDFGEVEIGTTKTLPVVVDALLAGNMTYEFMGPDSSLFRIAAGSDWNSRTGGTLNVTFYELPNPERPIAAGTYLRLYSPSDPGVEEIRIDIVGRSVFRPYLNIADPTSLKLEFSASVGGGSQTRMITVLSGRLSNPIQVQLMSGAVEDYEFIRNALDDYDNPSPGYSGIISVIFRPGAEGARNAILRISSAGIASYDIELIGYGQTEFENPEIITSVPSVTFGTAYIGLTVSPISVTVEGRFLTQDIQIQIVGDLEGNFRYRTQLNWEPQKGGVVEIFFEPKSIGPKNSILRFYTGMSGQVADIVLGGTGAAGSAPTIISEYYRPEVFAGETATFTLSAAGNPPPTFQWSQAGSADGSWVAIAGATSSTYSINPATATHNNMFYKCEASNGFGMVSSSVMGLTVLFPSLIVADSESGLPVRRLDFGQVDPGEIETKLLTVTATNLMVGRNVTHTISGPDASAFSCVRITTPPWNNTGGGLTVEFKPSVAGKNYEAVLTVSTEYAESVRIDLIGSSFPPPPPRFIQNPVSQLKISGETAEFVVALASDTAKYTLAWQKKGVRSGDDWMDIQGATGTLYRFTAIISESGTQYRCVARYTEGAQNLSVTSSVATLTVVSPVITSSDRSLGFGRVISGERVSLNLKVSGTYLTRDIDIKLAGADSSAFAVTKGTDWHGVRGGTLIVDFKPSAVGKNYAAIVTLSSSGADSVIVDLYGTGSQLPPPDFMTDPDDVICDDGDDVTFSVTLKSGTLDYKLRWQKLSAGAEEWTDISGSNRTTLSLRNVPRADNGAQYRCIAEYNDETAQTQNTGAKKNTSSSGTIIESSAATLTVFYRAVENPGVIRALGLSATFRFDGELAKVKSVRFNGEYLGLDGSKADVVGLRKDGKEIGQMSSGSVVVHFYEEFVDTLADGTYPVLVTFEDGSVHRGFLRVARANGGDPYTGDDNDPLLWYALMATSVSGMGVTQVIKKKAKNGKKK